MLKFRQYLQDKKIFQRKPNKELAKSLVEDAEGRINDAEQRIIEKPKYAFEQAYEAVRNLIEGIFAVEGYKTYSHEAAISILQNYGTINSYEIEKLDGLRQKRHDSKYYGYNVELKEAQEALIFLKTIYYKIKQILDELITNNLL